MPRSEIDTVRGIYAAINRNDIEAAVAPLDADVAWIEPAEYGKTCHGRDSVLEHLTRARATWAEGSCEPEQVLVEGGKVIVILRVHVRLENEAEFREGRHAAVYTFRDGLATEMRIFDDTREAIDWARGPKEGAS